MALLFISHVQLNTMLVGLVKRLDHITASLRISVTSLKRRKIASLFISHMRLNAILVARRIRIVSHNASDKVILPRLFQIWRHF